MTIDTLTDEERAEQDRLQREAKLTTAGGDGDAIGAWLAAAAPEIAAVTWVRRMVRLIDEIIDDEKAKLAKAAADAGRHPEGDMVRNVITGPGGFLTFLETVRERLRDDVRKWHGLG